MHWSPVKEEVFRFASDIVVSAGAGSGKTAALVELYLRLVAGETAIGRPLGVEEIVAITFTDKAAVEMKERVRREMGRRLRGGEGTADWKKLLRSLSTAPIATFHSFCSRLLRENPVEAGIDPSYTLLDETGAKAELQGALEELLDAEISARTPDMELLLRHYPLAGAGHGKGIQEYLLMLCRCRTGDTTPDTPLLEQANAWQAEAVRIFPEKHAELRALLDEVERILGGKELAFHDRLRQLPVVWQTAALAVDDPETPGRLAAMEACIAGNWGKERTVKEQIETCLRELQLAASQWRSTPVVAALVRLSGKLAAAYRLRKQRRGALDFDDLLVKSRDLLARDGELRQELQRRFAVVMVDEFQDTNPIQKELVDLLVGPEQRLFIVGDPKQSIYLFRGADVQVFAAIREEIISRGGSDLYFQESFRSRKGIIDFVNSLFSRIMAGGSNPFEVVYREGDHLIPERRDPDDPPCVEFITLDDTSDANQKRQVEATTIAARIRRLVQGTAGVEVFDRQATGTGSVPLPRTPRYGDIAILFRRFSNLKLFERALRREGIPYYVVKGRGFFHCQEILDICSLLRYLEFDGDLVALAGVLRSPLCGVSDETLYLLAEACGGFDGWERLLRRHRRHADEEGDLWTLIDPSDRERLVALDCLLTRLRPLRDRLTLAELLEEILTATDIASTLLTTFQGEQKVANLRKLIELSRSFASLDEGALRRFIAFLTELTTAEPTEAEAVIASEGEDVVRLMTVHQSKGLEFPIVFVPEVGAGLPGDTAAVAYDEGLGVGVKLPLNSGSWGATIASEAIAARRRQKEAAELKRLFYVAVTRARDYLLLSGEGNGEWRRWLDDFCNDEDTRLLTVTPGSTPESEETIAAPLPLLGLSPAALPAVVAAIDRALHYVPPLPETMIFSPTALEDLQHCPRKYFYKGVLGLDEGLFADLLRDPRRGAGRRHRMSALDKGNLAHGMLERLDFAADVAQQRAECLRFARQSAGDQPEEDVAEVLTSVTAFAASPLGREMAGAHLLREHPFTVRFTGDAVYYLKGAMDLVAVTPQRVTVYDYKYLAREGTDLEGYRFQLRTYMLALARIWPQREIRGMLLFLKGNGCEEVTCDFEAFEEGLCGLMNAVRQRRGEDEFTLHKGCDGRHCPFRQRCGTQDRQPLPLS